MKLLRIIFTELCLHMSIQPCFIFTIKPSPTKCTKSSLQKVFLFFFPCINTNWLDFKNSLKNNFWKRQPQKMFPYSNSTKYHFMSCQLYGDEMLKLKKYKCFHFLAVYWDKYFSFFGMAVMPWPYSAVLECDSTF